MSLEMELSLLSALCKDASQLSTLDLQESDFSTEQTQAIFKQVEKWQNHGTQPDIPLVWEGLQTHGDSGLFKGFGEVASALHRNVHLKNINAYCRSVKLAAKHGAIERLAGHIYDAIGDESENMQSRIDTVRQAMADFEAEMQVIKPASDMLEIIGEAYADLQKLWESGGGLCGVSTGLRRLDNICHGMQDGHLIIVAGRPSMGKTLLAQQLAYAAAIAGKQVEFITLEMSKAELGQRMIAAVGDIDLAELRSGQFKTSVTGDKIAETAAQLKNLTLRMSDDSNTLAKICSRARRAKLTHGLDMLVIDQLSAMPTKGVNKPQELKLITGGLKTLARELQIPIILLHQLNRDVTKKTDKKPDISELKDSGAVEEDADVVLLLHREGYYDKNINPHECDIILGKYRSGERGSIAKVGVQLSKCQFLQEPLSWQAQCKPKDVNNEWEV